MHHKNCQYSTRQIHIVTSHPHELLKVRLAAEVNLQSAVAVKDLLQAEPDTQSTK